METVVPGLAHPLLLKRPYVTVPDALKPFVRTAESVTTVPTLLVVDERLVAMLGEVLSTVRGSQPLVVALLLESPEYAALKL